MQLSSLLCFALQTPAALFSPDSQPHLTQVKESSCVPPPCPMDWKLPQGSVWGNHSVHFTGFSSLRDHILPDVIRDHIHWLMSNVFKTTALYILV